MKKKNKFHYDLELKGSIYICGEKFPKINILLVHTKHYDEKTDGKFHENEKSDIYICMIVGKNKKIKFVKENEKLYYES